MAEKIIQPPRKVARPRSTPTMVLSISAEGSSRARDNGLVSMVRSLLYSCLKEKETSVFQCGGESFSGDVFLSDKDYGAIAIFRLEPWSVAWDPRGCTRVRSGQVTILLSRLCTLTWVGEQ